MPPPRLTLDLRQDTHDTPIPPGYDDRHLGQDPFEPIVGKLDGKESAIAEQVEALKLDNSRNIINRGERDFAI